MEHGLRNVDDGQLTLAYKLIGDELEMKVIDNGLGRKNSTSSEEQKRFKKQSLATKITQERIDLLNAQLKSKKAYRFDVSDLYEDGTGTVVAFSMPRIT
ncbi:MAG: two-component system LytT family sensor kinase [Granulosicoccus sp.]